MSSITNTRQYDKSWMCQRKIALGRFNRQGRLYSDYCKGGRKNEFQAQSPYGSQRFSSLQSFLRSQNNIFAQSQDKVSGKIASLLQ